MMTTAKPRTTSSEASVRSLERMSMAAVPCLPLQGAWLLESPAFQSTEPAVVRAAFLMLERAWSATPAGTLPANPTVLAPMLGLTEHQLATNFEALSAGWTLADGRFVHEGMYALAHRIWSTQADALDHLSATAPLVTQAPEDFQLVAQDSVGQSPLKGKRRLSHDFGYTPKLREWVRNTLFVQDEADQDFIMRKFIDHARTKNEKFADPEAGFRLFASREDLRRLPSRSLPVASGGKAGVFERMTRNFGNSGDAATNRNRDTLDQVMGGRDAQSVAPAERSAA